MWVGTRLVAGFPVLRPGEHMDMMHDELGCKWWIRRAEGEPGGRRSYELLGCPMRNTTLAKNDRDGDL